MTYKEWPSNSKSTWNAMQHRLDHHRPWQLNYWYNCSWVMSVLLIKRFAKRVKDFLHEKSHKTGVHVFVPFLLSWPCLSIYAVCVISSLITLLEIWKQTQWHKRNDTSKKNIIAQRQTHPETDHMRYVLTNNRSFFSCYYVRVITFSSDFKQGNKKKQMRKTECNDTKEWPMIFSVDSWKNDVVIYWYTSHSFCHSHPLCTLIQFLTYTVQLKYDFGFFYLCSFLCSCACSVCDQKVENVRVCFPYNTFISFCMIMFRLFFVRAWNMSFRLWTKSYECI